LAIQSDRNSDVSTHSTGRQSGPKVKNLCVTRTCDVENLFFKQKIQKNIRQLPVTFLNERPVKKFLIPPERFRRNYSAFRRNDSAGIIPPSAGTIPPIPAWIFVVLTPYLNSE
jgi:hypothetical protein